jgi:hypothetical protein
MPSRCEDSSKGTYHLILLVASFAPKSRCFPKVSSQLPSRTHHTELHVQTIKIQAIANIRRHLLLPSSMTASLQDAQVRYLKDMRTLLWLACASREWRTVATQSVCWDPREKRAIVYEYVKQFLTYMRAPARVARLLAS